MPDIKCPNCNYEFALEEALNDELKEAIEKEKQDLRQKMSDHLKKKDDEMQRKETEWKTQQEKREQDFQADPIECLGLSERAFRHLHQQRGVHRLWWHQK